jgi:4-amino-4-deoxy-L-arabinose transferase-like glycosyltransferase
MDGISSGPRAFALLLTLSGLLFLTQLRTPLMEPQEPRYAEIAREMLVRDSFLVPVLDGRPYLDKPPLFYYLIMLSYRIFGVHDWAARLVPGLAGVFTVLLTWFWGRAVVGPRPAFWGALILCLSARFVYLQRLLTFDCVLGLMVTAALAAAHLSLNGKRLCWRWWLLSAFACGLGLLTKGPVALALILVPVLSYQWVGSRCPRPTLIAYTAYIGTAAIVAAPWFIAMMIREPGFAGYFFWTHNVVRFVAPFDHEEPFWFHLPGLLFGMLPWSLLLPGFLAFLLRRSPRTAVCRPPALGFFLLASLWTLLFFSLAGCKRSVYILPAIPPLALALGYYLTQILPSPSWRLRPDRLAGLASVLLLVLGLVIVAIASHNRLVSQTHGVLMAVVLVGLTPLLWFARLRSWPTCAGLTFGLLVGALHFIMPAYGRQFSLGDQLQAHRLREGSHLRVFCYPQGWESVGFYLPDAEVKLFTAEELSLLVQEIQSHPGALLLVRSGRWHQDLCRNLPAPLEYGAEEGQGNVMMGFVGQRREMTSRPP